MAEPIVPAQDAAQNSASSDENAEIAPQPAPSKVVILSLKKYTAKIF